MKKILYATSITLALVLGMVLMSNQNLDDGFQTGAPSIQSMSALEFSPEGILFVGDSRSAQLLAIDLKDESPMEEGAYKLEIKDLDVKIAALLGTKPNAVMVHDMAVNPISKNAYLAVSRDGEKWEWEFNLPKDIADATLLLKVTPSGEISEVNLKEVRFSSVEIPNPISADKKYSWKETSLRVEAISDILYEDGKVFVTGLSNEEFSSTMRVYDFPFKKQHSATSLEIYHGAHGAWETQSPVYAFTPVMVEGKKHLLAAYLCTPLVLFDMEDIKDGAHLKGKTIAELGYGNFPLDMITLGDDEKQAIFIANSNRSIMRIDPNEIPKQEKGIEEKAGTMTGIPYIPLPGGSTLQMAKVDKKGAVLIKRHANGKMIMETMRMR